MSVLIKDMEMPEKCGLCDLFHAESPMHCTVVKGHKTVGAPSGMPRPEWCPLVALPDKHGRLVDADALRESVLKWLPHDPYGVEENEHPYETDICVSMLMEIEDAPTIVEKES